MIELSFEKEVYTLRCIDAGIAAYKDLSDIEVMDAGQRWLLRFSSCKYGDTLTVKEFENYLIGLENTHANT